MICVRHAQLQKAIAAVSESLVGHTRLEKLALGFNMLERVDEEKVAWRARACSAHAIIDVRH